MGVLVGRDELQVEGSRLWFLALDESHRPQVEAVVAAHTGTSTASDRNAVNLRAKAADALALNADFLALNSPTSAQVRDQVRLLTRECNALIRLVVNRLESSDGT